MSEAHFPADMDTVDDRRDRLRLGFWTMDDQLAPDDGGLGDDGHVKLPYLLQDVGVVAQQVGLDAADARSAAASAAVARDAIVGMAVAISAGNDATIQAVALSANTAVAAAALATNAAASVSLPVITGADAGKMLKASGDGAWVAVQAADPMATAINTAPALTGGQVDTAADMLAVWDASAGALKRVAPANLGLSSAVTVQAEGAAIGTRQIINLIAGLGTTITLTDNAALARVDAMIAVKAPSGVVLDAANKHTTNVTLSNGNLTATPNGGRGVVRVTGAGAATGKKYFEATGYFNHYGGVGFVSASANIASGDPLSMTGLTYVTPDTPVPLIRYGGGSSFTYGGTNFAGPHTIGIAVDVGSGKWWVALDGVWQAGGNPAAGTGTLPYLPSGTIWPCVAIGNFGSETMTVKFGYTSWVYGAPTGFDQW